MSGVLRWNISQIFPENAWIICQNHLDNPDADLMQEDLAQIMHRETGLIIDIGWYPDSDPEGTFKILVIHHQDWENPLAQHIAPDLQQLRLRLWQLASQPPFCLP